MTATVGMSATTATGGGRTRPPLLVGVLGVTQTVGYGVLVYAFSVLLPPMTADLHASTAAVTGARTMSVLVAAGAAIPVGRWLDRHGGRTLMTVGSALGVVAALAWSRVQTLAELYAVFALIGLAGAMSLYEAAFAILIAAHGPGRREKAVLAVTVVAGFASSVFFPLTGLLLHRFGWRTTVLILACLLAAVTAPAHALVVPSRRDHQVRRAHHTGSSVRDALRDSRFWLLGTAFVAQAAAVAAVAVLLVAYLQQAGHPAVLAASISGLLGVMSVTGRLVSTGLAGRHGMIAVTAVVFAVQGASVALLPHVGRSTLGAAACVIGFGIGFGVATIARPAIVADWYGTVRYATISAAMTVPITVAMAIAPVAAASIAPGAFLTLAGAMCLAGGVLLFAARIGPNRGPQAADQVVNGYDVADVHQSEPANESAKGPQENT